MKNIKWIIAAAGAGLLTFLVENFRSNRCLYANHFEIESEKIPDSFDGKKIAFLSDLHNNELGKENEKIFRMLKKENPDYVIVGGDMLVAKYANDCENALAFMKKLASRYPVYCGNGNHESRLLWKGEECPEGVVIYSNYIEEMKKAGIIHLSNSTIRIDHQDEYIYLTELDLEKMYYKKLSFPKLPLEHMKEIVGECRQDSFHILLAHNPAYFLTYSAWGADLTLSGHVHGGIMRLPFLGGVIAPSYELFPAYDAGLYEKNRKKMIVSVGLGCHTIKIRLWNPPKIDFITLKKHTD